MMRISFSFVALFAAAALVLSLGWNASYVGAEVVDTDTTTVGLVVKTGPVDPPPEVGEREVRYLTIVIDEAPDQRLRVAKLPNTGMGINASSPQGMVGGLMLGAATLALGGMALRHMSNSEVMTL